MAVVSVNPARSSRRGPSTLEKVALGLDLASKTLGLAFSIPKFLQEKKLSDQLQQQKDVSTALEVGLKTKPSTEGAARAFEVPGFGLREPAIAGEDRPLSAQEMVDLQTQFPTVQPGLLPRTLKQKNALLQRQVGRTVVTPFQREKFEFTKTKEQEKQLKLSEGDKKALKKGEELFESSGRVLELIDEPEVEKVVGGFFGFIADIAASGFLDKLTLGTAKEKLTPKQLQFVRAMGLHFQKFRKETTGAAASYTELAYLRPLQPSTTDTKEQIIRAFNVSRDAVRVARAKRIAEQALSLPEDLREEALRRRTFTDKQEFELAKEIIANNGRRSVRDLIESRNPDVEDLLFRPKNTSNTDLNLFAQ